MSSAVESQTPAHYIDHAARHPVTPTGQLTVGADIFGRMLVRHFETMGSAAGNIFQQFYDLATEYPKLSSAFYSAVKRSFAALKPGSISATRRWDDVMQRIVTVADTDETLATYIKRDLIGGIVPALIGSDKASYGEYQATSDILVAAGSAPKFADLIDKSLAHRVTKWHLGLRDNDFLRAAEKLTVLRNVPPFADAVTAIEERARLHVYGEKARAHSEGEETLVARFDKARHHVEIFVVHAHSHPDEIRLDGDTTPYHEQIAAILLKESEEARQPWVEPIAVAAYCSVK